MRLCLMRYGVGRWREIQECGLLPGKTIQQLSGQTQRLLGQQALIGAGRTHLYPPPLAPRARSSLRICLCPPRQRRDYILAFGHYLSLLQATMIRTHERCEPCTLRMAPTLRHPRVLLWVPPWHTEGFGNLNLGCGASTYLQRSFTKLVHLKARRHQALAPHCEGTQGTRRASAGMTAGIFD